METWTRPKTVQSDADAKVGVASLPMVILVARIAAMVPVGEGSPFSCPVYVLLERGQLLVSLIGLTAIGGCQFCEGQGCVGTGLVSMGNGEDDHGAW